jgi:CheY-like chemotaxis protein
VPASKTERTQYRILVVDPDLEFADLVARAITDVGGAYTVTINEGSQEVLDQVREAQRSQSPFDLLIADVRRPGSGSMRVLEEIVDLSPQTRVITMTGQHSPELAARVQELGVRTYLVKPVAPSRFRRLVQDELAGKGFDTDIHPPPPPLSEAQRQVVERQLANLRRLTASTAVLLVHSSGSIRAKDCVEPDLDSRALCAALMDTQRSVALALGSSTSTPNSIRQTYFGTADHGVCLYRLDDVHAVVALFDATVREGQVWYYIRETAAALHAALRAEPKRSPLPGTGEVRNGFEMVERYFAESSVAGTHHSTRERTQSRTRQSRSPVAPAPIGDQAQGKEHEHLTEEPPDQAQNADTAPGLADVDPPADADPGSAEADPREVVPPTPPETKRLSIDEIDWTVGEDEEWDALVADQDPSFKGVSYKEAKRRGLLDDLEAHD